MTSRSSRTSTITMDSEYTSDLFVTRVVPPDSQLRCSGAVQRIVPPELGVEALVDILFFFSGESSKSVMRGAPDPSTSIFDWERGWR